MQWTTNTTAMRERSRRTSPQPDYSQLLVDSAARLQPAVGRRGLGPTDQEE